MRANQASSTFTQWLRLVATLALSAALMLVAAADVALAQSEHDTATARSLFEQGVELAAKGDWAGAADRFERSDKLRHSPVVAYNLANAWVELGRLVEAGEVLKQIDRDEAAKPAVKKDARSLLAQLEPRIATLVVTVESQPPPKDVRVNDRPLPEEALGVPTPIDPGSVVVTVTDGGQVLWSKRIEVTAGGQERITITMPKVAPQPAPVVVPTPRETAERSHEPQAGADAYDDGDLVDDEDRAFYEEPWVWIGAGVVVATGVLVAVLLASGGSDSAEPGQIPETANRIGTITVSE